MKGNNTEKVKSDNRRSILSTIYTHGPISRIEIAEKLSLTPPTITGHVSRLMAEGLIVETESEIPLQTGLGRRRVAIDFNPGAAYLIGLDISPIATYVCVSDLRGNIMAEKRMIRVPDDYDEAVGFMASLVRDIMKTAQVKKKLYRGIGISVPGCVSEDGRSIVFTAHYNWKDKPLADDISKLTEFPSVLLNDARARSITMELFSDMDIPDVYTYVYASRGIASPSIVGANDIVPRHVSPGELGHMVMEPDGEVCPVCGSRGCLQSYSSENYIIRKIRERWLSGEPTILSEMEVDPDHLKIEDILEAQKKGDALCSDMITKAVKYLGTAIANLIYVMTPSLVIIDSKMTESPENRALLEKSAWRSFYTSSSEKCRLEFIPWDDFRAAHGAAGHAIIEFIILEKTV